MKAINLTEVKEAGVNQNLPAGGYVCTITQVSDVEDKGYLYLEFDVAEGPFKNYFKELEGRAGFWGLKEYRSYSKEAALPMLKRFCSAVTKSNVGYIFDAGAQNSDEKTLLNKAIGLVLQEEEYLKNNGEVGTRLIVSYECEADKIRKGDFKVPDKKVLSSEQKRTEVNAAADTSFMDISGDSETTPFN